jgi:hypothetical protein
MTAKDVLRTFLDPTGSLVVMFTQDLSDQELLVRPAPKANHIAWQLGHLISSESRMTRPVPGAPPVELPPGFLEAHNKEAAERETGFLGRDQYLTLYRNVRHATLAALDSLTDADLDKEYTGSMKAFAPTLAKYFLLVGNHERMHTGQFTVVRRALGKPVLF